MTTPDRPAMQPRDRARLVLARDRALAAVLSRNSAASLADACPGLGPGVDPTLWRCSDDPDGHDDIDRLLAYRVTATRRELLELVGELSRRLRPRRSAPPCNCRRSRSTRCSTTSPTTNATNYSKLWTWQR
jgi:hypothetical protein